MSLPHLKKAIAALRVTEIYPRSLNVSVRDDFDSSSEPAELVVQWRHYLKNISVTEKHGPEEGKDNTQRSVLFTIETGLRYVTDPEADLDDVDDSAIGVEILADFRATYSASEELDKECLEEFGNTNALYHVWPYWRELIQSTCARFGLPPMVLPMYQVPVSNQVEGSEDDRSRKTKPES